MATLKTHPCAECREMFTGRSDKRFCCDQCRTTYNNRLRSIENRYITEINSILKKNRRILVTLNPEGKSRVHRDKMKSRGFNFQYFTSTYTTKDGAQYFYCYDQGYLPIEKDQCLLVIKKEF